MLFRSTDVDEIALKILEEKKSSVGKRSFERLNPSDQRLIEAQYRILQQAAFRKDFPRMLELSRKILLLVDDYGDTRAFEAVARKSLSPCAQKDGGCEL